MSACKHTHVHTHIRDRDTERERETDKQLHQEKEQCWENAFFSALK